MEEKKLSAAIESILFAIGDSVQLDKICEVTQTDSATVTNIINKMQEKYENDDGCGLKIINLDDSYQLCTKTQYYGYIRAMVEKKSKNFLSNAALEVLSIVAYNQPVTRSTIEFIRGVNSDGSLSKLIEFGFVEERGRLDAPGRPILFGTTEEFLRCFGLTSLKDLPNVDNPNDIVLQQEFNIDDATPDKSSNEVN